MATRGTGGGSRADEQRQRILDGAIAVFSRRGYRAASMNEVADQVGLRKPTLYHYVRTKQDLLVAVYEEVLDEGLRSAQRIVAEAPSTREALRGLIVERVRYTCEHRDLLTICFHEESALPAELAQPILERRRVFERVVRDAVAAHLRETGRTLPMSVGTYVSTCLGAANWTYKWFDPAGPRSPRELGDDIATVLLGILDTQPAG